MKTANALARFRKEARITLDEAASRLGVDRKTVLRWEQGEVDIPTGRVLDIEDITGISRHELRPDLSRIFISKEPASNGEAA
jgi:DNA-binding transcriptional regulator YdaS (Cro superfamily)